MRVIKLPLLSFSVFCLSALLTKFALVFDVCIDLSLQTKVLDTSPFLLFLYLFLAVLWQILCDSSNDPALVHIGATQMLLPANGIIIELVCAYGKCKPWEGKKRCGCVWTFPLSLGPAHQESC